MKKIDQLTIIKSCNIACAVLLVLLIILQFVPYFYDVQGEIVNKSEFDELIDRGVIPNELLLAAEPVSVATVVWDRVALGVLVMPHVGLLLFGIIGIVVCLNNRKSTLSGICMFLSAYCGLALALHSEQLGGLMGIATYLLAAGSIILAVYHVRKMIAWFTVEESEYCRAWK